MPTLDLAQVDAIAAEAHRGQTRRHGAPYIEHPRAVLRIVEDLAYAARIPIDDEVRAAALLHDVIEDSPLDEDTLATRTSPGTANRVALLTKRPHGAAEPNNAVDKEAATRAYYERLAREGDDALKLVKACDRCHNLSELHKTGGGPDDRKRLLKYVDETRTHVVPLVARTPALVAALYDAMRTALRAQHEAIPRDMAPAAERVAPRVPRGLYAIVDPGEGMDATERLLERVRALCEGGVALVQLRAKGRDDREVLEVLALLLHECARFDVSVIVNDRADLCVAAGADGVHVGRTDLPAAVARRIVGREALVGASTHNYRQAVEESRATGAVDAVDYTALGPVFASPTKSGHAPALGVDELARVVRASKRPICAIGGLVDPQRVADAAHAGAHLVACVSALALPPHEAHAMARRMSLAFHAAAR